MSWLEKFVESPAVLIATFGLLISTVSVTLSIISFRRDRGKFLVSLDCMKKFTVPDFDELDRGIRFRIVNAGRRRMYLTNIGFFSYRNFLLKLLDRFSPFGSRQSVTLASRELAVLSEKSDGSVRIYEEGELAEAWLSLSKATREHVQQFVKYDGFYVIDTLGNRHFASPSVFRTFKRDIRKTYSL